MEEEENIKEDTEEVNKEKYRKDKWEEKKKDDRWSKKRRKRMRRTMENGRRKKRTYEERTPFTVFTKTCFSLLGSFSSTRTPRKMRPNVPMRDKRHILI